MEIKTKKIIVVSVVVVIFLATALYAMLAFKKNKGMSNYISDMLTPTQTEVSSKEQAENEIKELREELFSGKNEEVLDRVKSNPINASSNFVGWEKYRGIQKIYLSFARAAKGDRTGSLDEIKEIIEGAEYYPDQKALAAMEVAYNLTTFDVEDLKNHLFSDGELKKSYVEGNLHETSKNIFELSYRFRPAPLSSYALSDYYYEKAAELKEVKSEEYENMAKKGAEYLKSGNELNKTMRTAEWTFDRSARIQLYKARIHEKINKFGFYAGDSVVYDKYEIEYMYKDILNATSNSKMIYYGALAELHYATFINNIYGYDERKESVDDIVSEMKSNISNISFGVFGKNMKEIQSRPDNSYEKKEILELMNKSAEFKEVIKSIGWQ